ncbi:MAG: hypothetical protein AAGN35_17350, partial [Bacteroidota bacterium]
YSEDLFMAKQADNTQISLNPNSDFAVFAKTELGLESECSLKGALFDLYGNSPVGLKKLSDLIVSFLSR